MQLTTTRDLSSLYAGGDDPQIAIDNQTFIERIDAFVAQRDQESVDFSDPPIVQQSLDDYEALMADYPYGTREMCYRYLRDTTEGTDEIKARLGQAEHLSREQMIRLQFFELNLGKIDPSHHQKLLSAPILQPYRHFLERIRASAQHDLSRETEKAVALLAKSSYGNWSDLVEDALKQETRTMTVDGKESERSFEELMTLTKHANKATRDQAATHIHEIVAKIEYMATRELNSILEYKLATDTLRSYDRPDASRIVSEDVDPAAVDALLQAVSDSNDIARDFYALKARLLGFEKLAYHERNLVVSLTDTPEPTYSYEQAVALVRRVFSRMDDDFVQILDRMSTQGLIDVYPRSGKRGGAFNAGMGQHVINVVMLNYTDTLNDVTTLAHEMGHACHTQLSYQHQNALNTDYGMLTAEVSSQFMEDYVYDELIQELDDRQRLELLMTQLNDSVSSIHRQIACYQYEQAIHQEYRQTGFVSSERLGELFTQYMSGYMGDAVTQDP
ncbi:MAG: hypothetical protein H6766_03975 [Candidatus Peribacteria bacterium]|nr:MAG: hypothetical protein H6766_03975 [Candidatus Peribacteria bacterium]